MSEIEVQPQENSVAAESNDIPQDTTKPPARRKRPTTSSFWTGIMRSTLSQNKMIQVEEMWQKRAREKQVGKARYGRESSSSTMNRGESDESHSPPRSGRSTRRRRKTSLSLNSPLSSNSDSSSDSSRPPRKHVARNSGRDSRPLSRRSTHDSNTPPRRTSRESRRRGSRRSRMRSAIDSSEDDEMTRYRRRDGGSRSDSYSPPPPRPPRSREEPNIWETYRQQERIEKERVLKESFRDLGNPLWRPDKYYHEVICKQTPYMTLEEIMGARHKVRTHYDTSDASSRSSSRSADDKRRSSRHRRRRSRERRSSEGTDRKGSSRRKKEKKRRERERE